MSFLAQLRALSSAEDFFDCLGVPYDPKRVNVARLHILRRMGEYLAGSDLAALPEAEAKARAADFLTRAYADFLASSPLEQRVFKVLKEAAKPAPAPAKAFVPLSALAGK